MEQHFRRASQSAFVARAPAGASGLLRKLFLRLCSATRLRCARGFVPRARPYDAFRQRLKVKYFAGCFVLLPLTFHLAGALLLRRSVWRWIANMRDGSTGVSGLSAADGLVD
jgi:hypothetical protein